MYRDAANALDERDRAVGAILIGEALVDECERARAATSGSALDRNEHWRTLTGVHDVYVELWRHLDRARATLASRGANTASYDDRRPRARRAATNADGTHIDGAALDDARRAIEELKLALPGADWADIRARTNGLARSRLSRARNQRAILLALLAIIATAITLSLLAIIPDKKLGRREAMRRELAQVVTTRQARIASLWSELGARCDRERARELTRLLVLDGRATEARALGEGFILRCGADEVIDRWANAPDPRRAAAPPTSPECGPRDAPRVTPCVR